MANEISITIAASVPNGSFRDTFKPGTKRFDQAAAGGAGDTVSLSSDSTSLAFGGVAGAVGWMMLTNLSTSIDIIIGPTTAIDFLRLPPSSSHVFHSVSNTTLTARTTASTASLQFKAFQV